MTLASFERGEWAKTSRFALIAAALFASTGFVGVQQGESPAPEAAPAPEAEAAVEPAAPPSAGAVAERIVDATDPEIIAALVREHGSARMDIDDWGDPMIVGRIDGIAFHVIFYMCDDGANCRNVMFEAGWDEATGLSWNEVDQWNHNRRFTHVELDDERDPFLYLDINLDYGVTEANLRHNVTLWANHLREFAEFLRQRGV